MKYISLIAILFCSILHAEGPMDFAVLKVSDVNNESINGARIECLGTGKVFYSNLKGEVRIPYCILNNCRSLKVESISYQTLELSGAEIKSKIILAFR